MEGEAAMWTRWCKGIAIALLCAGGGAALAQSAPSASSRPYADADVIRFAVLGDRTGGARAGIFEDAVKKVGLLLPEFVINVGDAVEGYAEDAATLDRQWDEIDRVLAGLPVKYHRVPGNHDLSSPMAIERWRQRYGPTYYHFLYKNALFLVLDTEDPVPSPPPAALIERHVELMKLKAAAHTQEQWRGYHLAFRDFVRDVDRYMKAMISDEQYDHFAKILAEHRDVRWTFVFLHKPAWRAPYLSERFLALEKLLADRPYSVFAGHVHEYHHEIRNGQDYIVMATTGAEVIDPFSKQVFDHIAWVTLDEAGPRVANLRLDGVYGVEGWAEPAKNGVERLKAELGIDADTVR